MHFKPHARIFLILSLNRYKFKYTRETVPLCTHEPAGPARTHGDSTLEEIGWSLDKVQDPFHQGRTQTLLILMTELFQH